MSIRRLTRIKWLDVYKAFGAPQIQTVVNGCSSTKHRKQGTSEARQPDKFHFSSNHLPLGPFLLCLCAGTHMRYSRTIATLLHSSEKGMQTCKPLLQENFSQKRQNRRRGMESITRRYFIPDRMPHRPWLLRQDGTVFVEKTPQDGLNCTSVKPKK